MTDLLPIMGFVTIGVVVLLIVVECVGLSRIVRRCDAGAKELWRKAIQSLKDENRDLKKAKKDGSGEDVVKRRFAVTNKREDVRDKCKAFAEAVDEQVNDLRTTRGDRWKKATAAINKFCWPLMKATRATVASRKAMAFAGSVLLLVLGLIQVQYYQFFGFNVFPYLLDYPVPALLLGLLPVLFVLGLLPLIFATVVVIVIPWAVLLLMRTVDGMRGLAAKGTAWVFFAACDLWPSCSYLALPLLDETSADSAPESGDAGGADDGGKADVTKDGDKFKNVSNLSNLISKFTVWGLFAVVCFISVRFEPLYQLHATCGEAGGSRKVRVVLDPPLPGGASFTKIGSIGGNVFIVPESCGRQSEAEQEPPGSPETGETEIDGESNGDGDGGGAAPWWMGFQSIVDQIQGRLQFLDSLEFDEPLDYSATVTVVPLGRVLCMHEVHEDGSDESAACGPLPRPDGAGLQIIVHETPENTIWTIVVPPDVRIRIDDEWRLEEEIARRLCDGGAAEISEPILFDREQASPADEPAARATVQAFLSKPELQDVELHVLGFASADGNSRYNRDLARQRAAAVATIVRSLDSSLVLHEESWGETHLTNGVANSRSVRIVGCRPGAEEPPDPSGQRARAATTLEPRGQEEAVVRWPI